MSAVECPNCNAPVSPQEVTDGWCDSCGKKLPPFVRGGVRDRIRTSSSRSAEGDSGERSGDCDLCEKTHPRVSRCYLKVTGQSITGGAKVRQRWINVRCTCCPSCYRKGRSLQIVRYLTVAAMLVLPALVCGLMGVVIDPLEKEWGMPRSTSGTLILIAFGLCTLVWVLSPFYIWYTTRRRLRQLLKPDLDERLRSMIGVSGWGWLHYVTAVKEIPQGETSVGIRGGMY